MIEIEILLTAIFIALCVIAIRLGKTNEHLSDCKRELSSAVPHLHAMRKDYEPPEPEPPPLTLDEAPQTEIRAKEQPTI